MYSHFLKGGYREFWAGFQPKMLESFLKGGILMFSKESIMKVLKGFNIGEVQAGLLVSGGDFDYYFLLRLLLIFICN